jgi:ketosteroid isomerase-like protein
MIASGERDRALLRPRGASWEPRRRHGWKAFWSTWTEQFEPPSFDVQGLYDAGDRVVFIARQRPVAKASRVPVEQVNAMIFTLRDGLITRMEVFNRDPEEALKAVGLAE